MSLSKEEFGNSATRFVFHGVNDQQMFEKQNVPVPELEDGEILVQVSIFCFFLNDSKNKQHTHSYFL